MKTLTVNEEVRAVLRSAGGLVAVHDPQGQLLGFFAPSEMEQALGYARAAAHFSPKEIRRIADSGAPTYSFAEVMAHLHSLGESRCATQ